ncbi:MAG: hypothetical protein K2N23_01290 [Clostridia bacterium]|nr:hypothetical protein [Clostridia bacterium]
MDKLLAAERAKQNAEYPLLSDFINDWLKVKKQTVKETTYKSYVNLLTKKYSAEIRSLPRQRNNEKGYLGLSV